MYAFDDVASAQELVLPVSGVGCCALEAFTAVVSLVFVTLEDSGDSEEHTA